MNQGQAPAIGQDFRMRVLPRGMSHCANNHRCLNAHRRHTHQQVDYFLFVVGEAVRIELLADGRVFGFLFFVLVENPFEKAQKVRVPFPS
jgi:hypothetical protein